MWSDLAEVLSNKKRILIIVGQNLFFSEKDIDNMNTFFEKYSCVYAVENLSNLECKGTVYTYPLSEMLSTACGNSIFDKLAPDLIISCGNNLSAYDLKSRLRNRYKTCEHWIINESGNVRDEYKCLTVIFECSPTTFFRKMIKDKAKQCTNNKEYYTLWNKYLNQIDFGDIEFSSLYIAKKLSEIIPENSLIHTAILNSTRVMQLFKFKKNIKMYSNIGALGIDGCLSTFMGQAATTNELAFLLIGDLSFFYDMNAAGISEIKNNVRIIMMNNGGGEEFHFFMGKKNIPTINKYISVKHNKTAEGWIKSLEYDYYAVRTTSDFDRIVEVLGKESEKPIFVEVFLDMEFDAKYLRNKYNELNDMMLPYHINVAKKIISSLPERRVAQVRKLLKI